MKQIFINNFFLEKLEILQFPANNFTLQNLQESIESKLKLSKNTYHFHINGKRVNDIQQLQNNSTLQISLKLNGGKGGFGSLMRNQAHAKKKQTSHEASRDLQGRRIRNVQNEKGLIEFLKKKQESEKKIKNEIEEYKKIEGQIKASQNDIKLNQDFKEKLQKWNNSLNQSILQGIKTKMKKNIDLIKEATNPQQEIEIGKEMNEQIQKRKNDHQIHNLECSKKMHLESLQFANNNDKSKDQETQVRSNASGKQQIRENQKEMLAQNNIIDKQIDNEKDKKLEKPMESPEEKFEPIELNLLKDIEELRSLGQKHIKAELKRLGLKIGGTFQDVVDRLWSIRENPANLFNPKFLAKK